MNDINPFFFHDPFIRPFEPSQQPPIQKPDPLSPYQPSQTPSTDPQKPDAIQISSNLLELPNQTLLIYRSGRATEISKGPDICVPVFNLSIEGAISGGQFKVNCLSTYPEQAPFSPIADRFEVRHFKDSFILTLADGCGLHPSSRLAPKAAIDGFWNFLIPRIKSHTEPFNTHTFGNLLKSALKAAHFNIYWDAYFKYHEGFSTVSFDPNLSDENLFEHLIKNKEQSLEKELSLIQRALKNDTYAQKSLINKHLDTKFYEGYAGATTFMCSALLKNPKSEDFPYLLLTLNLGDGQCFVFRDQELKPLTADSRQDRSNLRDPGGKMGLCTPVPLKMDDRNLQYSLTPCKANDLLLFMTDGVLDNLNPQKLGFLPNFDQTPYWVADRLVESTQLSYTELKPLFEILDSSETSWKELTLEKSNQLLEDFSLALLSLLARSETSLDCINQRIMDYCLAVTKDHRSASSSHKKGHPFTKPLGKPDHTTCLTYQVPKE